VLETSHGAVETPVFMPVGTAGTVKAMPPEFLEEMGAQIILANAYHLYLRPGEAVVEGMEGLHGFMSWNRGILTDSGGYQVFSQRKLRTIREEGVEFRSHLDGSLHFLSPEDVIRIQEAFGSDIAMVLDECTPYPVNRKQARDSMDRSMRWARRCRDRHRRRGQMLFGIVQGGMYPELRRESLDRLVEMDFPGLALGGFSVGEPRRVMYELVRELGPLMPGGPRYLMGVGSPLDLLFCVRQGIDMFDCVLPTRNARNGTLFTSQGRINIRNSTYRTQEDALDPECECRVCRRFSRAYLRHLHVSGEILSLVLNTCHNLYFYLDLMRKIRQSIASGSLLELEKHYRDQYCAPTRGNDPAEPENQP
jgi:queuine tRNA-ribosyltransferase